jgi:ABC-2 type transport system ATP-binding protein
VGGIDLQNVSYAFGPKKAVDRVSMTAQPGKFTALIGPNGAGKSTIFHLLCGLLYPGEGTVVIAGEDMRKQGHLARKKLGLVFQQNTLDLELTVVQNLSYFAAMQGLDRRKTPKRIEAVMAQFQLGDRRHERVQTLNGGHRRRLEIARALLHEPEVLVLDEPTVGLDRASKLALTAYAHDLAGKGITVLWITHLLDEIAEGDDVNVLRQGRIVASGALGALGGHAGLETYLSGGAL